MLGIAWYQINREEREKRKMNPFEIHGPVYLVVYLGICGTTLVAADIYRRHLLREAAKLNDRSGEDDAKVIAQSLEPYEAAYLAGGVERVFLTACGTLARHKLIDIDSVRGKITITVPHGSGVYSKLERVEQALLNKVRGSGESLTSCKATVATATSGIKSKLSRSGLIVDVCQSTTAQILPASVYAGVALIFAVPKFVIASQQHLPYSFLVCEMIVALAATALLVKNESFKTEKGHAVLKALADSNSALRLTHSTNPAGLSLKDCALAYGIFGALALAGDPFMAAHTGLHRAYAANGDSGSGCGSSCGSSCGGGCGGGCGG